MRDRRPLLFLLVIALSFTLSGCYWFTPLARIPRPAEFQYLWESSADGEFMQLELNPARIYGMGLTYASHLRETGSEFDPDKPPPVFKKSLSSLNRTSGPIKVPTREDLITCADQIEPGLGKVIDKRFKRLLPLLDYEGELAFILLEDVDWQRIEDSGYIPRLGYFLANDISARAIAVLGEGKANRYEYWGASKSFPGFLPIGQRIWAPHEHVQDSILSTTITTRVNGKIRQRQSTDDIMYTPREMLMYIEQAYPDDLPRKGDVVLTGTPGGVAMQVPAWKAWLANVLDLDRFTKLLFAILSGGRDRRFLKPGDEVVVSADILDSVKTKITQ